MQIIEQGCSVTIFGYGEELFPKNPMSVILSSLTPNPNYQ